MPRDLGPFRPLAIPGIARGRCVFRPYLWSAASRRRFASPRFAGHPRVVPLLPQFHPGHAIDCAAGRDAQAGGPRRNKLNNLRASPVTSSTVSSEFRGGVREECGWRLSERLTGDGSPRFPSSRAFWSPASAEKRPSGSSGSGAASDGGPGGARRRGLRHRRPLQGTSMTGSAPADTGWPRYRHDHDLQHEPSGRTGMGQVNERNNGSRRAGTAITS